jgi:hypothetical protein
MKGKLIKILYLFAVLVLSWSGVLAQDKILFKNIIEEGDAKIPQLQGNNKSVESLCQPTFVYGCSDDDGFTDFALEQIQNLNNGCADNTGFIGWSEYYSLGPALLNQGNTYILSLATGYQNQHVNIWIDFNDDLLLSADEMVLSDYLLVIPGMIYEVPLTIPVTAPIGQHAMRAMAVFQMTFVDPCWSYSYGEAEDYYVHIEPGEFGYLEGIITELTNGSPVEGATVTVGEIASGTSDAGGYYYIDQVLTGTWNAICTKVGYNPSIASVIIQTDLTTSQNFQLTQPQLVVSPLSVSVSLEPNTTAEETLNISNTGDGPIDWNAEITITGEEGTDNLFDLQFEWPIGIGSGEAGIECDGNFIYTSQWNGNEFYKYELDGTYVGSFTCGNAALIRDLAYDGTYFYGAAANSTVFQMDFTTGAVVSQFIAPTPVRAIAYNEDENLFYANNFDTDIIAFNLAGSNLGSFAVGPLGSSYYGFAYDKYSNGGPYLWGYAQTGSTLNELIQIQLPSGTETGVSFNVGSIVSVGSGLAGGLAITNALVPGYYTLLGRVLSTNIWGLELCGSGSSWLTINPNSGTLTEGESQPVSLNFSATNLIPGYHFAEVHFTSNPNAGSPVVDATLIVEGLIPAVNLDLNYNCTDVSMSWEMPFGGDPDSWNVYRDGIQISNVTVMSYFDLMVDPLVNYSYFVKAVYSGEESQPTATKTITLPVPPDLEPLNPQAIYIGNNSAEISWEMPEGCLTPEGYNVYRFGNLIGNSTTLSFIDTGIQVGNNEYFIRAIYYFGESVNSQTTNLLVGTDETSANHFDIFPNPTAGFITIQSPVEIIKIVIRDNSGKLIMNMPVQSIRGRIDVSGLEKGLYFVILETAQERIIKKITIH